MLKSPTHARLVRLMVPPYFIAAMALTGCQSKPVAPPPGETPQAVSPVAAVPVNPVNPGINAAPIQEAALAAAAAATPAENANTPAPVVPKLPSAAKTHSLATTTKAQAAIVGLGAFKSRVKGSLVLSELADGGVNISGVISGLSPGEHGFHVHEHGDCKSHDGMSAGGHFNPTKAPHGTTDGTDSHVGDLGNIKADGSGKAFVDITKKPATLGAGPSSFLGRAFIVHGGPDDLKSQPAGESGARVGCGVIKPML